MSLDDFTKVDQNAVRVANIQYHNKHALEYEADVSTHDIFQAGGNCEHRVASTLGWAAEQSGGSTLVDVCCGTGHILGQAKGRFDNAIGLDLSTGMMAVARARGFCTIGGDALNMPIKDESVDCVTAFSALHHIYDYEQAVREMARILKPHGIFYSDWDPNGHVTHEGWAVKSAVWVIKQMRLIVSGGAIEETREQSMAEFHHSSDEGFQAEKVVKILEESGVGDVKVSYHVNPPTLNESAWFGLKGTIIAFLKLVSGLKPERKNVMPWVAITGIKRNVGK